MSTVEITVSRSGLHRGELDDYSFDPSAKIRVKSQQSTLSLIAEIEQRYGAVNRHRRTWYLKLNDAVIATIFGLDTDLIVEYVELVRGDKLYFYNPSSASTFYAPLIEKSPIVRRQFNEALEAATLHLERRPKNTATIRRRAELMKALGDTAGAAGEFERADAVDAALAAQIETGRADGNMRASLEDELVLWLEAADLTYALRSGTAAVLPAESTPLLVRKVAEEVATLTNDALRDGSLNERVCAQLSKLTSSVLEHDVTEPAPHAHIFSGSFTPTRLVTLAKFLRDLLQGSGWDSDDAEEQLRRSMRSKKRQKMRQFGYQVDFSDDEWFAL